MKVVHDGLTMGHTLRGLSESALWVGLCTFNIDPKAGVFERLPKESHVLIGLPSSSTSAWLAGQWLKTRRPDLVIVGKTDCHAKYALIRRRTSRWLMVGSANLTNSPAAECVLFLKNPEDSLWDAVAKFHERLIKKGTLIPPMNKQQPLSREQLRALSSTSVET